MANSAARSFRTTAPSSNNFPPGLANNAYHRHSNSGRYSTFSRDSADFDASGDLSHLYMVHMPPTPDNQPMGIVDPGVATKADQHIVSNSIFTGGYNSMNQSHVLDKIIDGDTANSHMAGSRSLICGMKGCDGRLMRNERGEEFMPCECNFKICRDCYKDACKAGGKCPGCKELYKTANSDDLPTESGTALPLPPPEAKMERRLSFMKSKNYAPMLMSNQNNDFDHSHWLYDSKGTYGFGNAVWPKEGDPYTGIGGTVGPPPDFKERARRPLSRKVKIPPGILSPYRLLVVVRFAALCLFLSWRIMNPNTAAIWLWGLSVVCEIWFAFSWILDQLPKLCPVNRDTDLAVLKDKFEQPSSENPSGRSDLPGIDIFVSTADPEKEPPLVTANTILSILAADYPVEKLACYLSDDGGALLTFEAVAEAASFGRVWVPFCRKHNIEPRNPEAYFNLKRDQFPQRCEGIDKNDLHLFRSQTHWPCFCLALQTRSVVLPSLHVIDARHRALLQRLCTPHPGSNE